jgi:hypothetical protein
MISLLLIFSVSTLPQTRGVFTSNTYSTTQWDSISFGMLSRQVIINLDSENTNDTLWISFSEKPSKPQNSIMLLSQFGTESLILNVQSRFIKTKASAILKRRIIVQ